MNNVVSISKSCVQKVKSAAQSAAMAAVMAMSGASVFAFQNNIADVEISDNFTFDSLISKFAGLVLSLAQGVGVILIIWGAVQLASSFKSEEGESKTKAIWIIIAGVALFALRSLLNMVGIIS